MTTPFANPFNLPELASPLATTSAGAVTAGINAGGHLYLSGLYGTGTPPTVAVVTAGAGAGSSVGSQLGFDFAGSFNILTAGSPAPGNLATVVFGTALSAAPAAIMLNCWDITGAAAVAVGPTSITGTGFTVSTGATATTAHHLLVSYVVLLQQA